jgi:dTDP-4-amino-4,6-dideoxygalactose transaminase
VFTAGDARLPVTEELSRRMMSIPFHSLLTDDELDLVVSTLVDAVARHQ